MADTATSAECIYLGSLYAETARPRVILQSLALFVAPLKLQFDLNVARVGLDCCQDRIETLHTPQSRTVSFKIQADLKCFTHS